MNDKHSKVKGNVGEMLIAADLIRQGYPVFTELGDNSKVDLIALVQNQPVKIQVKARAHEKNNEGIYKIDTRKSGPNYSFRYTEEQVDIFAVYCYDIDLIFYISSKELLTAKSAMTFRSVEPRGANASQIRMIHDYTDLQQALRDYQGTPDH